MDLLQTFGLRLETAGDVFSLYYGETRLFAYQYGVSCCVDSIVENNLRNAPKHPQSTSQAINIGKYFVRNGAQKGVLLVQCLPPNTRTSIHYHSLPEEVIVVDGEGTMKFANRWQDQTDETILQRGARSAISPFTTHQLQSAAAGLITVPIKIMKKGLHDHFRPEENDILFEAEWELMRFFNSGGEMSPNFWEFVGSLVELVQSAVSPKREAYIAVLRGQYLILPRYERFAAEALRKLGV